MTKDWKKKRRFRQSFARFLGSVLRKPRQTGPYDGPKNSILILAQEKFGDAILLTPLLRNLKAGFPSASVEILAFSKTVSAFFRSDGNVDRVHYAKGAPLRYIREVLPRRFDMLFNTKDHPSTNFLLQTLLVRARCTVGIDNEFHRGIYDYLTVAAFHAPIAFKNCSLLAVLGKPAPEKECRPYIPPMPVSEAVRNFLGTVGERTCCGINISAGGATRCWTEEQWTALVRTFPEERFVILSSPSDLEEKKRLERSAGNILPSPETSNIYEAGLITARLKILVTPDTAMVHVASSTNTPVTGLYGKAPQDRSRFSPFLVDYRMAISHTALVRDITVETVAGLFRDLRG